MIRTQRLHYQDVTGIKYGHHWLGEQSMFVYIYHVDGMLIDTGQSFVEKKLLADLNEFKIDQVLITHHHEDHTGNVNVLSERLRWPIYASDRCCKMMKSPPSISLAQRLAWGRRPPFNDLIPLESTIHTNKFHFQIIAIPGHAEDMIALFEPEQKWLFSADLFIHSRINYFLRSESILQQINSIKKVLKLDFAVLFCSHQPKLREGRKHLEDKLGFLERFYSDVAIEWERGYRSEEIFEKLKLKENRFVKWLSGGALSRMNMVESVIRDKENAI